MYTEWSPESSRFSTLLHEAGPPAGPRREKHRGTGSGFRLPRLTGALARLRRAGRATRLRLGHALLGAGARLRGPALERTTARIWRASTSAEQADEFERDLERDRVRPLRHEPGNRGVLVLRSLSTRRAEYLVLSLWESMDAARREAGLDAPGVLTFPRDPEYLAALAPAVSHYEVMTAVVRGPAGPAQGTRRDGGR